jgi:Peptidase_C39 like family
MSHDLGSSGDLPAEVLPWMSDLGIDVPQQLDMFSDGEPTVTIGNVGEYAAFNHQQGDNPYGITEDCGLVSSQDVLNQFGVPVTESDVVTHALQNGECQYEPNDIPDSGGTSAEQQAQILSDYGVPAHADSGQSMEQLAGEVEQGHGVIASVNAGVLWGQPQYVEGGGDNHAVTVTGVARDPDTGAIQGFYINDSGTGKSAEFIPAATMEKAWQDTGGVSVVTDSVHVVPESAGAAQ